MLRQPRTCERRIQFQMQSKSPTFYFVPRHFASSNRQKPIAVFIDPEWDEAMLQDHHARKKQTNQMHDMFPAYLAAISKILFELLELGQHVCVIRSMDELG